MYNYWHETISWPPSAELKYFNIFFLFFCLFVFWYFCACYEVNEKKMCIFSPYSVALNAKKNINKNDSSMIKNMIKDMQNAINARCMYIGVYFLFLFFIIHSRQKCIFCLLAISCSLFFSLFFRSNFLRSPISRRISAITWIKKNYFFQILFLQRYIELFSCFFFISFSMNGNI